MILKIHGESELFIKHLKLQNPSSVTRDSDS